MVRLKDIAKAAGVSTGTVSAALSGTGRIGSDTRDSIRRIAREMEYQPNAAARMLRRKPSIDAGMIIADEQVQLVPEFTQWCEEYRLRHQLELISSAARHTPSLLANHFAAGVVHVGYIGEAVREFVAAHPDFPLVAINEKHDFCVRSNFAAGARQAIQYLTALGHRYIGVTTGDLIYDLHQQLDQGLKEAFREFHFDTPPLMHNLEVVAIPDVEIMRRCLERARAILRMPVRPTAFFCSGMMEARALVYAGQELGLTVPGDFSIIAVGTRQSAESGYPAITTVGNDNGQLLTQAMLLLQRRMGGGAGSGQDVLVDTRLDIRDSTGKRP